MSEYDRKAIGLRIKAELKAQKKTQVWLAEQIGIEPGYLSELMTGHLKKRWNLDLLSRAAKTLGVPLSNLTGYTAKKDTIDLALEDAIAGLEEHEKKVALKIIQSLKKDDTQPGSK